jgi:hypothetical protein
MTYLTYLVDAKKGGLQCFDAIYVRTKGRPL